MEDRPRTWVDAVFTLFCYWLTSTSLLNFVSQYFDFVILLLDQLFRQNFKNQGNVCSEGLVSRLDSLTSFRFHFGTPYEKRHSQPLRKSPHLVTITYVRNSEQYKNKQHDLMISYNIAGHLYRIIVDAIKLIAFSMPGVFS